MNKLRGDTYDWLMSWKLSLDVAPPPHHHHLPEAMSHISFHNRLCHAEPDKRGGCLNPDPEEDISPLMSP